MRATQTAAVSYRLCSIDLTQDLNPTEEGQGRCEEGDQCAVTTTSPPILN